MTDPERQQILKMVEDGKVSAEEALKLMKALDADSDAAESIDSERTDTADSQEQTVVILPPGENAPSEGEPMVAELKSRARGYWQVIIWLGVLITVLGAYNLYHVYLSNGAGAWFFLALIPVLIGAWLLALAVGSRGKRWLYVDVQQVEKSGPRRILFALPLGFVSSLIGIGANFKGSPHGAMETLRQALANDGDPVLVKVDNEDGERVTIFIS